MPGDSDLTTLSGVPTRDATVLEFDFVPEFSTVQFQYVFSSDEYNEWANSQFNDTFAFFVNGANCARVPGSNAAVAINTINLSQNPSLYRNNSTNPGPSTINTEMDGLTVVLTCFATVNAGQTNHMKLAIADGSDTALDSNVFIAGSSLVSGTGIQTALKGGGQTSPHITVPNGTLVSDSATILGPNPGSASGTVTYSVFSDAQCTSLYASGGTKTVTGGVVPDSDPVALERGRDVLLAGVLFGRRDAQRRHHCVRRRNSCRRREHRVDHDREGRGPERSDRLRVHHDRFGFVALQLGRRCGCDVAEFDDVLGSVAGVVLGDRGCGGGLGPHRPHLFRGWVRRHLDRDGDDHSGRR